MGWLAKMKGAEEPDKLNHLPSVVLWFRRTMCCLEPRMKGFTERGGVMAAFAIGDRERSLQCTRHLNLPAHLP